MGVAALHAGELEYMLMRRIASQSDNQGPWPLDDKDAMVDVVRLTLEPTAIAELNRASHALALEHPPVMFYLHHRRQSAHSGHIDITDPTGVALRKTEAAMPVRGFPATVFAELFVRLGGVPSNAKYVIRLQNLVVPPLSAALGMSLLTCTETTLTMQQARQENEHVRLQWNAETGPVQAPANKPARSGVRGGALPAACDTEIELAPLDDPSNDR